MASTNGTAPGHPPVALDADALLAIDNLDTETIAIPEWGVSIVIRPITQAEAEEIALDSMIGDPHGRNKELDRRRWNRLLVQKSLVTPPMDYDQVDRLFNKSAHAVSTILKACMEINGHDNPSGEEDGAANAAFPVERGKTPSV